MLDERRQGEAGRVREAPPQAQRLRRVGRIALTIERQRRGTGFTYIDEQGGTLDAVARRRVDALAIPPAWTEVRIAADPRAHLQAVGRDEAGRWQYRYHPEWTMVRNRRKLKRLARFAEVLPSIRAQVRSHLRRRTPDAEFAAAAAIAVIDHCALRAGHEEYERRSGGRGCATLRKSNAIRNGKRFVLSFRGKGGKKIEKEVTDRLLLRALKCLEDIAGSRLFQYVDEAGGVQSLSARDINRALRRMSGCEITAKDFRTFSASVQALALFRECKIDPAESSDRACKIEVNAVMKAVSEHLVNTPAVTRSSYVPELLVTHFMENGVDVNLFSGRPAAGYSTPETALVRFLRKHAI
jgi:DNA topoisomerase I